MDNRRIYHKDEILQVEITDIADGGEGIGRVDGYTLFVKDAVIGDTVRAKIMKAGKSYAFARLVQIVSPSDYRVPPRCPVAKQCGGCQIQELSYEKQLQYKQEKVKNDLIRIGGFSPEMIERILEPIVGMDDPWRFRNKAQMPVGCSGKDSKAPTAGFYAGRTHSIIPVSDCLTGAQGNSAVVRAVLTYMKENNVPAYDEQSGRGIVRHILIRTGFSSGQVMVCIVANAARLPGCERLIELLRAVPGMTSISININKEKTNVILGRTTKTLWGSDTIKDSLRILSEDFTCSGRSVDFRISPRSFYQVNPGQTEKLYSLALQYAGLDGTQTVWDIYCGIGTISLFLAGSARHVFGVEIIPEAVEDARSNAVLNNIANVTFETGKAEEVLPAYIQRVKETPDVVVVDPPRKGCDEKCLQAILQVRPQKIVYISCDPATLSRDLKTPVSGGYQLQRVRPVDQFGHTVHVETVVLLTHKD